MGQKRYNIFISYAWADNVPFEGKHGWVSIFVDRIGKHLGRELSRQYAGDGVWLDYERLRGNNPLKASIRAKVEASRILVPIVSRSYLDSPWCREELEIFLERHGPDSGRIFPIWMSPTDDLPPLLDDLLKYQFWYEDDRKQSRTRWFPDIDATDREYGRLQQDMARDLATRIEEIRRDEQDAPEVEPTRKSAIHRPTGNHLVLLNGGEEDTALVQEVADRLRDDHGIGIIVPLTALPDKAGLKSSDITRDLREWLKLCSAVLLVYHDGPVNQIRHQIAEILKVTSQRRKGSSPPTLGLCSPAGGTPPGVHLPQMRNFPCGPDCAADCAQRFASGLP